LKLDIDNQNSLVLRLCYSLVYSVCLNAAQVILANTINPCRSKGHYWFQ